MTEVLIRPIITEKMTRLGDKLGQYGFVVDKKANKLQIKQAVEAMYGITVEDVRTSIIPAKLTTKMTKSGMIKGRKSAYKKAFVTLAAGESIDFYSEI